MSEPHRGVCSLSLGRGLCVDTDSHEMCESSHQTVALFADVPSHPFLTGNSFLGLSEPQEMRLHCWNVAASTPDSETPLQVQVRWSPRSENSAVPSPCGQTWENCDPRLVSWRGSTDSTNVKGFLVSHSKHQSKPPWRSPLYIFLIFLEQMHECRKHKYLTIIHQISRTYSSCLLETLWPLRTNMKHRFLFQV